MKHIERQHTRLSLCITDYTLSSGIQTDAATGLHLPLPSASTTCLYYLVLPLAPTPFVYHLPVPLESTTSVYQ